MVKLSNGTKERISGTPSRNTRDAAEQAERAHIDRVLNPVESETMEVIPTFREWFYGNADPSDAKSVPAGRFWNEWVIPRPTKPSEMESKQSIYRHHLDKKFGKMRLDQIGRPEISLFKGELLKKGLSPKRINNVLAVLSKPLKYAADVDLVARAPKVGLIKVERPEIEWWELSEYARLLEAAKTEGPEWYAAACLAGEAGLRIGEVRALRWIEDVDLVAGTITVHEQTRKGITGTPKGGTRRKVPMTGTLLAALKRLDVVRTGYVARNLDGGPLRDGQTTHAIYRICRRAGLPERGWHSLRHSFGTHTAMFGVNPWRLQCWMGHKSITETHLYVHMAGEHMRPLPPEVLRAGAAQSDPDRRIILMLGSRAGVKAEAPVHATEAMA